MNKPIGKYKLSEILPYLNEIAFTYNLKLNRVNEYKMAKIILATLYR